MIFHNKDAKRSHFHCFPWMLAGSCGMVKVGSGVYQEVFKKQLLIIKILMSSNDCFSGIGLCNTHQKAVRLYFVFVEILYHERLSIFIVNKGNWWLERRSGGQIVKKCKVD